MSSSYYTMLDDESKRRYLQKLSFNGFQLPDPLDDDIRKLVYTSKRFPNVNVFDIYSYLVEKHKMYSKLAFSNYYSLPCYNYLSSGKVTNIKCYRNEIGVCVVSTNVEASQKAKKIHMPWIVATHDGEILSGHCTCMAGLGETCSHVGATLFCIEKIVRDEREKPACTSQPCEWSITSTNVEPAPVAAIDFTKPGKRKPIKKQTKIFPVASDSVFNTFVQNLKTVLPSAAVFTVQSDDSEDTDSAEETDCRNNTLTFAEKVRDCVQCLPENSQLSEKQMVFQTMFKITEETKTTIEVQTKTDRQMWKDERSGRLTASNFGKILKCKNSHDSLILDIMGYRTDVSTEAVKWGETKEKIVKDTFFNLISTLHVNLSIHDTGLIIDRNEPYLAATPDGIVSCDCCEDHILEIKCPFLHKNKKIAEIEKNKFFLDENGVLKESHNYYDQVQGQMAITGAYKCYFVTFTEKELHFQTIDFDELRWRNSKEALKHFFFQIVFPEIVSSEVLKGLKAAAEECTCKTKKIVTVVKCQQCKKMFHRACVNLRKKTSWSCDGCKNKVLL